ncbi:MAG: hypothetical protein LBR64_02835 [Dysgonamonadaceae bacterium]|jgi:Flp pilus assembly protein TadD|nr:hypothetical protein [Dysgonamonadaceae bacterium]
MNRKILFHLLSATILTVLVTACSSGLKPLTSDYVKATPQPLELQAGKVPVTINATFPAKYFNKKAVVTVTPVLRYEGGEAWGTSYTYQGEKVAGNGQVIPESTGANVVMTSSFDYVPAMQSSELYLTFTAKVGSKEIALPEVKIGDGVLATAGLLDASSETPVIAPDKFQRIIKDAYNADIMFLIQQAELRSSELKKEALADWKNTVTNASQAPNQKVDVEIQAYASPDGGLDLNEKLAANRESNTNKYLNKELKKAKIDVPVSAKYTAEDWEGFKELVEKSNIQDKNLILSVLSMYKDPEQREREIKNISSVFSVLADEILPQLRRSRLTANIETIGKSDEELAQLAVQNPKSLSVDELLYAANLAQSLTDKEAIYKKAAELYPNDFRTFNNLGVVEYQEGKIADAEAAFTKALSLSGNAPETNLNLGLVSMLKNNLTQAQQYFGKASSLADAGKAAGLLAIANGNYSQAVSSFGNSASNNSALAQLLSKDYSKALSTLNAVSAPNATTSYLKAIVSARTNDVSGVVSNLKEAIKLDPTLVTKAASDLEFSKYLTNSQFASLLK